jgi:glyoxylase-like metal-dependent hydrolase (beta-lactamase superfamily II)
MQAALQKVRIGNVEIAPLADAPILMNPRHFIPQHADQFIAEYGAQADERGLFEMSITCFLVRSAGKTLLIDSGVGNRRRPNLPVGKLDDSLREAGVAPADIDAVINTHLHIDHVGWNTVDQPDGTREIFFPNARFVIQQPEWDFWMTPSAWLSPATPTSSSASSRSPIPAASTFSMARPLDEHLTFVPSPGHTPGHVAIGIYSQGERAIIVGDASHHRPSSTTPTGRPHSIPTPCSQRGPVTVCSTRRSPMAAPGWPDTGRTWHRPHPSRGRQAHLPGALSLPMTGSGR